jgi:inosose dehydratase
MNLHLASGPASWGVDFLDAPANPPAQQVLDEVASSGLRWTELGPLGYFPEDPEALRAELDRRGLGLGGSGLFEPLHDPARLDDVLDMARRTARTIAGVGGRYLVVMDVVAGAREQTSGRSGDAPRLTGAQWEHLRGVLARVAEIAHGVGLRPVVHPHAGTYIEFADEIEQVLAAFAPDELNLCIDTGHCVYAGVDPVELYATHAERVEYFHFKDVDPAVLDAALAERLDFWQAVTRGVFCPLGRGSVDFAKLAELLERHAFEGWATLEQDVDPGPDADPVGDTAASLAFLRSIGLAGDARPA